MKPSQRDRILYELRQAGEAGVRGDTFLRQMMPRYAARICELRSEGFDIRTEDDDGMARYRLYENCVGVGAGVPGPDQATVRGVSVDSGDSGAKGTPLPPLGPAATSEPEPLFPGYDEYRDAA